MNNITIEQTRTSKVLEAMRNDNVLETILNLMHPQQSYGSIVVQSHGYDIEQYKGDAVDYENLIVSIPLWAKNILEINELSLELSELLLTWQDDNNTHFWDYNIESFLSEHGYDEHYNELQSDYTYNDSDGCRLDRDIHYTLFNYDGDYYVCFSIHHGADARIGFSDSIVLKVKDADYFFGSMGVTAYDTVTDIDYQWYELDNVAKFNKETQQWHMNETGNLVNVYSSANGF